jgi:protein gp37
MGEFSKISWTDHTFNAWIGCTKVSLGCKFCYAEQFAHKYNWAKWGNNPRHLTADSTWAKPLAWQKRAEKEKIRYRVFCSSLSDVFEDNPQVEQWRKRLWEMILRTPNLDWLLLTKRPENYEKFFPQEWKKNFPQNIWIGMTICTQAEYDKFFAIQKNFQREWEVKISFISFEPLLQPIILKLGAPDWSIIGGESGFLKDARPMELAWVQSIIAQIKAMNDKPRIFFKQMGSQLAKKLNMQDKKGEMGIDELPSAYDWLKLREFPNGILEREKQKILSLF